MNVLPPGFVSQRAYAGSHPYLHNTQAGGFAVLPALTAAYGLARKYTPFKKAKGFIENNFGQHSNSLGYKIAHGIASGGAALGLAGAYNTMPAMTTMGLQLVPVRRVRAYKKPGPKRAYRKKRTVTRTVRVRV